MCLDASKAYDRVVHERLFDVLKERGIPMCFLNVIVNWYDRLCSRVKWNGVCSEAFNISCGIRQGGVLSPFFFNVYVDSLICELKNRGLGCHVGKLFVGCIMYADDLVLLSVSLRELQDMVNICHSVGINLNIIFNERKTFCVTIGKMRNLVVDSDVYLGDSIIPWMSKFKYLGVFFEAKDTLIFDYMPARQKFYTACNCIFNYSNAHEPVKLQLFKSACLPFLLYSVGGLELSKAAVRQLSVCYNDGYRKIFGYNRWESVKNVQRMCGDLPFEYLYDSARLRFYCNLVNVNYFLSCLSVLFKTDATVSKIQLKYSCNMPTLSKRGVYECLFDHFDQSLMDVM
jgi:hypothetical protein